MFIFLFIFEFSFFLVLLVSYMLFYQYITSSFTNKIYIYYEQFSKQFLLLVQLKYIIFSIVPLLSRFSWLWGCSTGVEVVGNMVFFEGREHCLQSQLGPVVVCNMFDISRPSTTLHPDCGFSLLETVLLWISTVTLLVLSYIVTVLSCKTCCPASVPRLHLKTVLEHRPYLKANWLVINITDLTWSLTVKTGSLPVLSN